VFLIELRAFAISVVVFGILFFALTTASNSAAITAEDLKGLLPWLNATAHLLYVVAGFVAGIVARRHTIVNGLIAGVLAAATAILIFGVTRGDSFGIVATVVNGGILGGIGGACAMFLTRRKESHD
jgi:hypothetical protein